MDTSQVSSDRGGRVRWFIPALLVAMSCVPYLLRTSMPDAELHIMDNPKLFRVQLGAVIAAYFGGAQLTERPCRSALAAAAGRQIAFATGILITAGDAVGDFMALVPLFVVARPSWLAALGTGSFMALLAAARWHLIRADQPMRQETRISSPAAAPAR